MKRTLVVLSCAILCLSIALSARAQGGAIAGAITGIVKDPSGLPVANAMVEAANPALIEKSRTTHTDDQGLYKIVNLPAGTYTVTFSADGFNRVQREGVELMTSFTATVDATMAVGSVTQTVTVTEAVPVLDTTSTEVQKVLANNVLASLPIGKSAATFVSLIPGAVGTATNQDVGGTKGENTQGLPHSREPDRRLHPIARRNVLRNAGGRREFHDQHESDIHSGSDAGNQRLQRAELGPGRADQLHPAAGRQRPSRLVPI